MKTTTITPAEFNEIIENCDKYDIKYRVIQHSTQIELITQSNYFICRLYNEKKPEIYHINAISHSFHSMCKYHDLTNQYGYYEDVNLFNHKKIKWGYDIAYGFSYANEYYSRQWLKCWSYDINSAFSYAMLQPMPNTKVEPRYNDFIKKNEIGFYKSGGATTEVGEFADIIFPLMPSPFSEYIYRYYKLKQEAKKGSFERTKYKDFLNIPTGLVCKKNVFIRNAIIYYSNEYIKQFIDDKTVYCNVDCIVSLVPRPDLPIGEEIGQFKLEHACDNFKYIQPCIYQWNTECHYSGIPGETLTDIENIKDWKYNLDYIYKDRRIIKNEKNRQNK